MRSYLWLAAAIATTMPVLAADEDKFELHGKKNPTPVSGFTGRTEDLVTDGDYQGLRKIVWGEQGDEPCGLYIGTSHINRGTSPTSEDNMKDKSVVKKYVFGVFDIKAAHIKLDCGGNMKSVSTMSYINYIYKLNVCTTDKRDSLDNKLKGIRIWSRTLRYQDYKPGSEPILTDESTPHEDIHRPHCDRWHKPVACGVGEIATGLRVHYNEHGSISGLDRDTITGLALICRKLRLKDTAELSDTPIDAPSVQDRAPARVP